MKKFTEIKRREEPLGRWLSTVDMINIADSAFSPFLSIFSLGALLCEENRIQYNMHLHAIWALLRPVAGKMLHLHLK